jgi:osmotically-inducible protein OsmY
MKTDAQLRREVLDELRRVPCVDAGRLAVAVRDGVVTLTGSAPVYAHRFAAEEAARRVPGVQGIANDIETPPPAGQPADIAGAVLRVLHHDAAVPDDRVRVIVRDGWVTLQGMVDSPAQKEAADRAVRPLIGARGLSNLLLIKPGARAGDETTAPPPRERTGSAGSRALTR